MRGKLAIGVTVNFVNRRTVEETQVPEISGVARIYNQSFFQSLLKATGQDPSLSWGGSLPLPARGLAPASPAARPDLSSVPRNLGSKEPVPLGESAGTAPLGYPARQVLEISHKMLGILLCAVSYMR